MPPETLLYRVGDTVDNYLNEAVTIIEIITTPPADPAHRQKFMDAYLVEHPHAHFISGRNLADDPKSAGRVIEGALYVLET